MTCFKLYVHVFPFILMSYFVIALTGNMVEIPPMACNNITVSNGQSRIEVLLYNYTYFFFKSKRSRFMTLSQAATKSFTNFSFPSELP